MSKVELLQGDCLERMKELDDNSVDSIVTDPPYGLSFMGKHWDKGVPSAEIWAEALRVLKPGGHLLAFAGTRTQHRMAVNIEDAGFEIRDMIAWVYGSGFPKSHDVSKAIDKAAGAEREVAGRKANYHSEGKRSGTGVSQHGVQDGSFSNPDLAAMITAPATEAAKQWDGWGTALKPALEPITVARKPFKGTVAANVLENGTGAINIDGCRVGTEDVLSIGSGTMGFHGADGKNPGCQHDNGRWPANLIHDGSDDVVELFPVTGPSSGSPRVNKNSSSIGTFKTADRVTAGVSDSGGSAARFFYCAKASKKDRGEDNKHPTVKPTDLMRYLCRLVTPPDGIVLDPFMGSGSTGKAAMLEGFRFVGIELESESFEIASSRIEQAWQDVNSELF